MLPKEPGQGWVLDGAGCGEHPWGQVLGFGADALGWKAQPGMLGEAQPWASLPVL